MAIALGAGIGELLDPQRFYQFLLTSKLVERKTLALKFSGKMSFTRKNQGSQFDLTRL